MKNTCEFNYQSFSNRASNTSLNTTFQKYCFNSHHCLFKAFLSLKFLNAEFSQDQQSTTNINLRYQVLVEYKSMATLNDLNLRYYSESEVLLVWHNFGNSQ